MQFVTSFAVYFIFWWITLFAMLPIGLRTQEDDQSVVNGSVKSAPSRFRGLRIFIITTVVSAVLFAIWHVVTQVYGFGVDSLPRVVPDFS